MSESIFEKLVGLDSKDRIGARGLLELVIKRKGEDTKFLLSEQDHVEREERVIFGNSELSGIYHSGNLPANSGCLFSRPHLIIAGEYP